MEKNIIELISDMMEMVNTMEQKEDAKICLLRLCKDIEEKTEAEAIRYDTKFIERTIRDFGYCLSDEVNNRCKKIVTWYSTVQEENRCLKDQLLNKDIEICSLKSDLDNKPIINISKKMQKTYDHIQKVNSGKLHYNDNISNEEIARLYKEGKGATEIGKKLGCSRQTVINRLKGMDLWRNRV